MHGGPHPRFAVHDARPEQYGAIGSLLAETYAALPGMPDAKEQPEYYSMLRDVAGRARNRAISVFVATGESGDVLGSVDFIHDVKHYGSGGTASTIPDSAGIRLLAVRPECRGWGIGKSLTRFCIERARASGRTRVILHTTKAMATAWAMYEKLGFQRLPSIDFLQGRLEVFGFQLALDEVRLA